MEVNKTEIITDFLTGGVLRPKDIVEALGKKKIKVSSHYVSMIKHNLVKNKKLKLKKKKTKRSAINELLEQGYSSPKEISIALRKKRINISPSYVCLIKNYNKTKRIKSNREKIYVRGEDIKYWAEKLGITKCRVYQLYQRNELEDRIDGNYDTNAGKPIIFLGKKLKDWASELGYSYHYVVNLHNKNELESRINGTWKCKPHPYPEWFKKRRRMVEGKCLSEWAKLLGITRERARQLANDNKLIQRIEALKNSESTNQKEVLNEKV